MYIIAGLGNPGSEYELTRHNIGFRVIDELAEEYNISISESKHKGLIGKGVIEGQRVILVKPQTFMNLSGECIRAVIDYYKESIDHFIVVYDDISLGVGKLRVRPKGSAGGHNGIKNIIAQLGTDEFARVKFGVGDKPKGSDLVDHVLGRFSKDDEELAKAFSALVSYSIKDSELSNVFKLQLRALQDSIVDKTEAYATIKKQNEKILAADKLKNEFLANISHELRTPLNAIIGFSEALSMKMFGPLNEKQEEYVSDIHVSGLHLLGMINEILELSKIEAKAVKLALSRFNLQTSLNEVVNIVRPLANKKHIELEKTTKDFLEIDADYQKIQQILYNLLSNAIKFTPDNGKIEIGYTHNDEDVQIFVKDNGVGIDKKYEGKIFGKFVQLNNVYSKKESSTGLGLTITKELVELHGGKIWFESTVGKGTTFYVKLPLVHEKKQEE